jgi:hypothetical protein
MNHSIDWDGPGERDPDEGNRHCDPLLSRMEVYAARFDRGGKPQHADTIRMWVKEVERLRTTLERIRDHWACQYDHPRKASEMYRGPYGIGVTDGHRAAASIARDALGASEAIGGDVGEPSVDEIIVWFNAWLKEPISERERVIINEVVNHAMKHPADLRRAMVAADLSQRGIEQAAILDSAPLPEEGDGPNG